MGLSFSLHPLPPPAPPFFFFFFVLRNRTSVWKWKLENEWNFSCRNELAFWSSSWQTFSIRDSKYFGFVGPLVCHYWTLTLQNKGSPRPSVNKQARWGSNKTLFADRGSKLDLARSCRQAFPPLTIISVILERIPCHLIS